jgi:hypothetical protein
MTQPLMEIWGKVFMTTFSTWKLVNLFVICSLFYFQTVRTTLRQLVQNLKEFSNEEEEIRKVDRRVNRPVIHSFSRIDAYKCFLILLGKIHETFHLPYILLPLLSLSRSHSQLLTLLQVNRSTPSGTPLYKPKLC